MVFGVFAGVLGGLAVVVWWAFFSRAPRPDRWGAVVLMVVALALTSRIIDKSIATGMMGSMFALYAIPVLSFASPLSPGRCSSTCSAVAYPMEFDACPMVATIVLASGGWTLLRTNGITGDAAADFAWRWSKTPEERLVTQPGNQFSTLPAAPAPAKIPAKEPRS